VAFGFGSIKLALNFITFDFMAFDFIHITKIIELLELELPRTIAQVNCISKSFEELVKINFLVNPTLHY
jgi:hypothetical protein